MLSNAVQDSTDFLRRADRHECRHDDALGLTRGALQRGGRRRGGEETEELRAWGPTGRVRGPHVSGGSLSIARSPKARRKRKDVRSSADPTAVHSDGRLAVGPPRANPPVPFALTVLFSEETLEKMARGLSSTRTALTSEQTAPNRPPPPLPPADESRGGGMGRRGGSGLYLSAMAIEGGRRRRTDLVYPVECIEDSAWEWARKYMEAHASRSDAGIRPPELEISAVGALAAVESRQLPPASFISSSLLFSSNCHCDQIACAVMAVMVKSMGES
ncbi:hypothetical protein NL676_033391 [Syzygium grande]|nr:hypothetical protein NL676_033391 [Syzygium grande]